MKKIARISLVASAALAMFLPNMSGQTSLNYSFSGLTAGATLGNTASPTTTGQDGWFTHNAGSGYDYIATDTATGTNVFELGKPSSASDDYKNVGSALNTAGQVTTMTMTFCLKNLVATGSGGNFAGTASTGDNFFLNEYAGGLAQADNGYGTTTGNQGIGMAVESYGPVGSAGSAGITGMWFAINPAGTSSVTTSNASPVTTNLAHWYSLELVVDPTALSGHGSGTLYLKDLTLGGSYTAVTGLSNIDMNLENATGVNSWTSVSGVNVSGNGNTIGGIGNFNANSGVEMADFSITSVPEPQTWVMMATGFGMLMGGRRMRRKING